MSRNNFNINTSGVLSRIGSIIGNQKNEAIARVLGVEPQTCSNWKSRNAIPWKELFTFCELNNVSFEWVLTGKDPSEAFIEGLPEDIRDLCHDILEIVDSGDEMAILALRTNIAASKQLAVRKRDNEQQAEEMDKLKKRVKYLEKLHKSGQRAGTDAAATSNTGKKAM